MLVGGWDVGSSAQRDGLGPIGPTPLSFYSLKCLILTWPFWGGGHTFFFVYFFGRLECVGHSFAYVAHLWFLRDVWIRTQSTAVASWRATDLATHPSTDLATHPSILDTCIILTVHHHMLFNMLAMLPAVSVSWIYCLRYLHNNCHIMLLCYPCCLLPRYLILNILSAILA